LHYAGGVRTRHRSSDMPDDPEQARTLVMIHIDDARAAIESAGRRISDPAARAELERAMRALQALEEIRLRAFEDTDVSSSRQKPEA
jgi:hypothetical protein